MDPYQDFFFIMEDQFHLCNLSPCSVFALCQPLECKLFWDHIEKLGMFLVTSCIGIGDIAGYEEHTYPLTLYDPFFWLANTFFSDFSAIHW